jgi:hypothetical protein
MARQIVQGLSGLRSLLAAEQGRFAAAPILLISSNGGGNNKDIDDACTHVHHLLAQQLGLRTVVSHALGDAAFPTRASLAQLSDLAARVGAGTVCAVGSQAAVHAGQALAGNQGKGNQGNGNNNMRLEEVILVPATYPAVLASGFGVGSSLLMDVHEETLMPSSMSSSAMPSSSEIPPNLTIATPVDTGRLTALGLGCSSSRREAAFACLAQCLAQQIQHKPHHQEQPNQNKAILEQLDVFCQALGSHSNKDGQPSTLSQPEAALVQALLATGERASWGLEEPPRDVTLAVAVSLLPQIFPQSNALTIMASLVPALLQMVEHEQPRNDDDELALLRDVYYARLVDVCGGPPPPLVSTQSMDTLLAIIRDNATAWQCLDARRETLRQTLQFTSLVD